MDVQIDTARVVPGAADRHIRQKAQFEVASGGGQDEGIAEGRRSDRGVVRHPVQVSRDRTAVAGSLADRTVLVGAEREHVWAMDAWPVAAMSEPG